MKKNLNVGQMVKSIHGAVHSDCSNDGAIEKYCHSNIPVNCQIYGGLYDWNEMMQYYSTQGSQTKVDSLHMEPALIIIVPSLMI